MGTVMAKTKSKAAEGKPASTRQPTAITVRGSKEWRSWVEKGAKFCLTDTAKLVDIAIATYLKERGFAEPRPER